MIWSRCHHKSDSDKRTRLANPNKKVEGKDRNDLFLQRTYKSRDLKLHPSFDFSCTETKVDSKSQKTPPHTISTILIRKNYSPDLNQESRW